MQAKDTVNKQTADVTTNQSKADGGWSFMTKGGIVASPILVNNLLFFGSTDGFFYTVDINTHKAVWSYKVGNPIHCQAAVLDKTIFFSCMDVFYALDIETGNEKWVYDIQAVPFMMNRKDAWDYHDAAPVIDNGVVYFACTTGGIRGFNTKTGEVVWEYDVNANIAVRSTPLIYKGVIYYGDWYGRLWAVDIKSRKLLWKREFDGAFQSCFALKDNILIAAGRDTKIHALDITTGYQLWEYKDPDGSWITGDPTIVNDIVYIPTSDAKKVYAMNINDGSIVSIYKNYNNAFTKALIDNDLLYIASGDAYAFPGTGKIEVFQIGQPDTILGEIDVPTGGIFTTPILEDDILYFGCQDGFLYAKMIRY